MGNLNIQESTFLFPGTSIFSTLESSCQQTAERALILSSHKGADRRTEELVQLLIKDCGFHRSSCCGAQTAERVSQRARGLRLHVRGPHRDSTSGSSVGSHSMASSSAQRLGSVDYGVGHKQHGQAGWCLLMHGHLHGHHP